MKYSTLFTILSILVFILPWTGFPFGFIRLIISLFAAILFFLSIGLYQREQKINLVLRDIREQELKKDSIETNHTKDLEISNKENKEEYKNTENPVHKRRLSDMIK